MTDWRALRSIGTGYAKVLYNREQRVIGKSLESIHDMLQGNLDRFNELHDLDPQAQLLQKPRVN